jgi:hypothetical protein
MASSFFRSTRFHFAWLVTHEVVGRARDRWEEASGRRRLRAAAHQLHRVPPGGVCSRGGLRATTREYARLLGDDDANASSRE